MESRDQLNNLSCNKSRADLDNGCMSFVNKGKILRIWNKTGEETQTTHEANVTAKAFEEMKQYHFRTAKNDLHVILTTVYEEAWLTVDLKKTMQTCCTEKMKYHSQNKFAVDSSFDDLLSELLNHLLLYTMSRSLFYGHIWLTTKNKTKQKGKLC